MTTMRYVMNYFTSTIPPYIDLLPNYDIVIIQRASHSYYGKGCLDRQEIYRTSGDTRRSILNHHEMVNEISSRYPQQVLNIVLERSSLYFQYKVFSNAKIIIAQHGASLANIFFMQNIDDPSGDSKVNMRHVNEIMTPWT